MAISSVACLAKLGFALCMVFKFERQVVNWVLLHRNSMEISKMFRKIMKLNCVANVGKVLNEVALRLGAMVYLGRNLLTTTC